MDGHQFQPKDCEISRVCERMSCEEPIKKIIFADIHHRSWCKLGSLPKGQRFYTKILSNDENW